jgi:hypothetical protein
MFYVYLVGILAIFGGGMYVEYKFHPIDFVLRMFLGKGAIG